MELTTFARFRIASVCFIFLSFPFLSPPKLNSVKIKNNQQKHRFTHVHKPLPLKKNFRLQTDKKVPTYLQYLIQTPQCPRHGKNNFFNEYRKTGISCYEVVGIHSLGLMFVLKDFIFRSFRGGGGGVGQAPLPVHFSCFLPFPFQPPPLENYPTPAYEPKQRIEQGAWWELAGVREAGDGGGGCGKEGWE